MFLAFFSSLLVLLGLVSSSLKGEGGRKLTAQLSTILAPGVWQLVSDSLLRQEVTPWTWQLFGWISTLVVGTQVMNLILDGIHLLYGDREGRSFLSRQLRGLLLFCVSIGTWLVGIGFSVYTQPLREWTGHQFGPSFLVRGVWAVMFLVMGAILRTFVLALIYRAARTPGTTWRAVLPGAAAAAILLWGIDLLFRTYVRKTPYAPVYGELAAAIGLMLRLEASAMIVFLGAAWNAERAVCNASLPI